jgi:hypothetical protein
MASTNGEAYSPGHEARNERDSEAMTEHHADNIAWIIRFGGRHARPTVGWPEPLPLIPSPRTSLISAAASPHRVQLRYSPEALRDPGTAGSEVVLVECSTHDVSSGRRGCVVATGCDDAFVVAPGSGPGLAVAPGGGPRGQGACAPP